MSFDAVETQRVIARLMSASVPVEQHLQQGKPLTAQQLALLTSTIKGLQTFIEIWKRKNNVSASEESFLSKFQHKA